MRKKPLGRLGRYLFRNAVAVSLAVCLMCIGVFAVYAHDRMSQSSRQCLRDEMGYIARGVEMSGLDYFTDLSAGQTRVTWVGQDGTVLYDSQASADEMENHADREEIQMAFRDGQGESQRYSRTLSKKTVNRAMLLADGTVLRLSVKEDTTLSVLGQMSVPIILMLVLAALWSVLTGIRGSRQIVRPINELDLQTPAQDAVYEELRPLVARINAQNEQIREQMVRQEAEHEERDKFRREFTANISHELKTPLTSISGFAEIIRDGVARSEDIPHFADNIYKESQRLIVLVGDIIKISRMDDLQHPIQKERLNLLELCRDVVEHLRPAADLQRVGLRLEGTPEMILGAWQIVDEMIFNLCDNAIKYNRPGGEVCIRVSGTGDGVSVSVQDTGIGIPQEHQQRVFERFYRVDKSHSKQQGGTGLGLSIVKHGTIYHGAALKLESCPGVGTTITVTFPRLPEKEE